MSLINDALKKAQRERSGSATPPSVTPPVAGTPPPPAAPAPRARGNPWPLVVAVVAVAVAAAVWFLKPAAPAPVVASTTPSGGTAEAKPAAPQHAPAPEQPAAPAEQPELKIRIPESEPPAVPAAAPVPSPAPAPVAAAEVAPPPAEPAPSSFKVTLQMEDPRILAFLDAARINGVRAVADDAKLLMNNKVFRVGATVDRELGLKLVQILPAELVFEDSRGIQYRKLL